MTHPELPEYFRHITSTELLKHSERGNVVYMPEEGRTKQLIPIAADSVRAGFPSPAQPYLAGYLDFNEYLVSNPLATIGVYLKGDSLIDAGLWEKDLLVVNRSAEAKHGNIVVVDIDNEFTAKRLIKTASGIELHPDNNSGEYPIIRPRHDSIVIFVGVAEFAIKKLT